MDKHQGLVIGLMGLFLYFTQVKSTALLFSAVIILLCWLEQFFIHVLKKRVDV